METDNYHYLRSCTVVLFKAASVRMCTCVCLSVQRLKKPLFKNRRNLVGICFMALPKGDGILVIRLTLRAKGLCPICVYII